VGRNEAMREGNAACLGQLRSEIEACSDKRKSGTYLIRLDFEIWHPSWDEMGIERKDERNVGFALDITWSHMLKSKSKRDAEKLSSRKGAVR
jgi:hypothetical protein